MTLPSEDIKRAVREQAFSTIPLTTTRDLAALLANEREKPAEAKDLLRILLEHPDPIVRYNAIFSLGSDHQSIEDTPRFLEILANDPDADCRDAAVAVIGPRWRSTKEPEIVRALLRSVHSDEDPWVKKGSYLAVLLVIGIPDREYLEIASKNRLVINFRLLASVERDYWPNR